MSDNNNIAVIGAGAWGTALAHMLASAGRKVSLFAREPGLAGNINTKHDNNLYLTGIPLHAGIFATDDLAKAVQGAEIILTVTPAQYFRDMLGSLKPHLKPGMPVVNAAKGIEMSTGKLPSEVAAETLPDQPFAVLSGPNFAHEVAKGLPAAVTFAVPVANKNVQAWAQALSSRTFRLYLSHDPVGAEIAGAVKNVVAIACGIVDGKGLGQNAKAAVMTRGMAEIRRLGVKRGAQAETFLGLSGLGDLTLTCSSMSSRNYSLGASLGKGEALEDILSRRNSVAEGVTTARAIALNAHKLGVEMPICEAVDKILHHKADIDAIIGALLARDLKEETI
jgi:glycerol-3-phosphate dehydrogenase (NAD(P)+)